VLLSLNKSNNSSRCSYTPEYNLPLASRPIWMQGRRCTWPSLRISAIFRGIFIIFRDVSKFVFIYLFIYCTGFSRIPKYALRYNKSPWNPAWQTPVCNKILLLYMFKWPLPWLKLLIPGLLTRRPCLNTRLFCGNFCEQSCNGIFILQVFPFFPVSIIPPVLHTHWFIYNRRYIISTIISVVK
jgi:sterol desaturase/sphingolipid hydroxylase (fatty acid hydroxylase superfamily)